MVGLFGVENIRMEVWVNAESVQHSKQGKHCKPSLESLESLNPVSVTDYLRVRGSRWPWLWWVWLWVWPWPSGSPIYSMAEDSID